MSTPRPAEHGRSTRVIILEIALLVLIPTIIIYVISKVWK